jgi:hypothetical protein
MYLYLLIMKESFVSFCFVVEKKIIYEPRTSSSHQDSDQDEKMALPKDAVEKCSRLGCRLSHSLIHEANVNHTRS